MPVVLVELPATPGSDDAAEATAYYVVAEAVTNAQKHAHASSIHVRVGIRDDLLRIEVADDGVGGAKEAPGLRTAGAARPRRGSRGSFTVDSDGHGTRILGRIPAQVLSEPVP